MEYFGFKSGRAMQGSEAYKRRLAYSVTVRISALKSFITKVLEYKGLNRIKFVCIAMCDKSFPT